MGISFNTYDDTIDESEIFEMSGLDNYRILNELLTINLAQQQRFFAEEQLKGNLPASYFAQIATQDLIGKITEMQAALSHYLASESRILSVNRELSWNAKPHPKRQYCQPISE
ncbi:exonuclease V subunit gamma [Mannheimia haemolytica]|uniref:Exonuclease V subunit gamma n=1 Tax=Mannheimia haemolytica TaxID=75985 RepID=A0A378MXJ8_MANHA|nr:exonuclease V subunit gamma [Mannheimia haemolytica]